VKRKNLPDHLRFGYAHMIETREIQARLILDGHDPEDPYISLAVSKAYTEAHKDDLTFSQRQDLARWNREKWVPPYPQTPAPKFTNEEMQMIAERFYAANDPIGQSIHDKAKATLKETL
jgi:3',5'-cyclic AMP phosphodiesterase CpdA